MTYIARADDRPDVFAEKVRVWLDQHWAGLERDEGILDGVARYFPEYEQLYRSKRRILFDLVAAKDDEDERRTEDYYEYPGNAEPARFWFARVFPIGPEHDLTIWERDAGHGEVDLHGYYPEDVDDLVTASVRTAYEAGLRELRIIHGHGFGRDTYRPRFTNSNTGFLGQCVRSCLRGSDLRQWMFVKFDCSHEGSARARQRHGRRRAGLLAGARAETVGVPDRALEELRTLAPSQARYALGTKSGEGRAAKGWNVILPIDVVERRFEGL